MKADTAKVQKALKEKGLTSSQIACYTSALNKLTADELKALVAGGAAALSAAAGPAASAGGAASA